MPCPPNCLFAHLFNLWLVSLPSHLGPSQFPGNFYLVAASSASRATMFVCCCTPLHAMLLCFHCFVHKGSPLFWLGFEFCTVFPFLHQSMRAGFILQRCVHLLYSLLNCAGPLRHFSSIFCQFVCLFVTLGFLFLDRCALTCSTSTSTMVAIIITFLMQKKAKM